MTSKAKKQEAQQAAIARLREDLQPGDTVYTIVRHISASGMSRSISCYITRDKQIWDISYHVALVIGYRMDDKNGGMKVSGYGMDMGFHVVYTLSSILWPGGFQCIGDADGERCPSNDHANYSADKAPEWHADGGYALIQRWL